MGYNWGTISKVFSVLRCWGEFILHGLPSLITDLALILLLAGFTTLLCKKFKQPLVLGYILAGFLCGPVVSFLPTVADHENITLWSEIGVIFLMFAVGLEFSIHKLVSVGMAAILSALFEVSGMMLLGVLLGQAFGWSMMDSIFLGGMLGVSSTMIAIKALEDYGMKQQKFAGYAIGTLIIEDIVAIFLMVILSTLAVSQGFSGFDLLATIAQLLFYLAIWLILGIYLLPTFLNKVKGLLNDEMLLVLSLGVCLGMAWIADLLGFSSALGAFMAGSILAGTVHAHKIEHLVTPCKDLFGAVFFVSVGLMVEPATLAEYWLPILLITIVTVVGKIITLSLGMMAAGKDIQTSVSSAFCLTQIGEFSFIIATLGTTLGVTSDFLYPIIVAVSVITAFGTPLMLNYAEPCARWLSGIVPKNLLRKWEKYAKNDDDNALLDKDWRAFGSSYLGTTLLYSVISLGLIILGISWLAPLLEGLPFGKVLTCVLVYICILPFIRQLLIYRNPYLTSLWLKGLKNRVPLVVLMVVRALIAMFLTLTPLYWLFRLHPVLIMVFGALLTGLLFRFNKFTSMYLKIEARFLANFNERQLSEQHGDKGDFGHNLNETRMVRQFICTDTCSANGAALVDLDWGRLYHLKVIKIKRGRHHINIPERNEKLHADDIVLLLGDAKDLENFAYIAKRDNLLRPADEPVMSLKDYIEHQNNESDEDQLYCCAVLLDDTTGYVGKTIRDSSLKQDLGCFLLGVERHKLPIIDPSPNFLLEKGDLVWVLGPQHMGKLLVNKGLV